MPELPEITILAEQMNRELAGRRFSGVEIVQPKSLNLPPEVFTARLVGQRVERTYPHGKWVVTVTTDGYLLINLGMGGEVLLRRGRHDLPEKYRAILDLQDGACLTINFWWFGSIHWADRLNEHPQVGKLGLHALDPAFDVAWFAPHRKRKTAVKSFLLDQKNIAGIGNMYAHDVFFRARLHPLRPLNSLSDAEISRLVEAVRTTLQNALDKRGSQWEQDLYGHKGEWGRDDLLVGYREGQPCLTCGTPIQQIKTGGTSSFICPRCQPLQQA
jgi:formamidopyrimidine-DNA glycosylase